MINNKKNKRKKQKKIPEYRNKKERSEQVKEILKQLCEFDLNTKYEPVQKLYIFFKKYIQNAERIIVNIPFPEINRRIKGLLAIHKSEDVTITLIKETF
jgi:hypothetical protein